MHNALQYMTQEMTQIFVLSVLTFLLAMFLTPFYTFFAYRYRFWKKQRTNAVTGDKLKVFSELHKAKLSRNIPTMAGIISVVAIAVVTLCFNLDRSETWLPLAALVGGAVVGAIDDYLNVFGKNRKDAGLRSWVKFLLIIGLGLVLGWFFYTKLGVSEIHVPFYGELSIGWMVIPLFAFAVVSTGNAVNISDGLDGLAGGLLGISFATFGVIALLQGNVLLAGFCFTVVGALLSYLWFNIYPARFFMGDIGSFAFGVTLGVVAMLTDTLLLLPVIGFLFVIEAGSSLIQIASKKMFGKKIFLSAPIHHHLEASGWPEAKVTMRFWVIGCVMAFIGFMLALAGGHVA